MQRKKKGREGVVNRFKPKVGGISYKYLGSVQKYIFNHNSAVLDAPNLPKVLSSFLGFFLLGFPPTLAYRIILHP